MLKTTKKNFMSEIIKIENANKEISIGELYLVPCIVREEFDKLFITPVFNHPHSDIENGQKEIHYHVDYRFVRHKSDSSFPTVINNHSKHYFVENTRPEKDVSGRLDYYVLPVINTEIIGVTPSLSINKSKLKSKIIKNNKCPHRGFDLSNIKTINDKITCPLHGLVFCSKTKRLIQ